MIFDTLTMLELKIAILKRVIPLMPEEPAIAADYVTDDVIRAALLDYFGSEPEWSDDLLEPAFTAYKETTALENYAFGLAGAIAASQIG